MQTGRGNATCVWLCVFYLERRCVCILFRQPHTQTQARARSPAPASLPSPSECRPQRHISSLPPRLMSTHDRSFSNALNPMVGKMVGVLEKPHT